MQSLNHKIALITGAATGVGKAIALRFGQEGCHVIVNYLAEKMMPLRLWKPSSYKGEMQPACKQISAVKTMS
ncbi:MAG: SDR family NAD(P)-dependent oxidoreductase [Nitrosomonas sp.]|nr:SDR family NAD(P)-dependent oxidoreductase [Nitrosomonas sp.]